MRLDMCIGETKMRVVKLSKSDPVFLGDDVFDMGSQELVRSSSPNKNSC